jgi:hypothetical protein
VYIGVCVCDARARACGSRVYTYGRARVCYCYCYCYDNAAKKSFAMVNISQMNRKFCLPKTCEISPPSKHPWDVSACEFLVGFVGFVTLG